MMESQKYAVVDLETTGHSPANGDRMIQMAIVIMQDWEIKSTFTSFINPGKEIPYFIQDLTNICNEDVQDALPFEAYAEKIYDMLQGCIFVAHNADFDLTFLQAEFKRAGFPKWHGKKIDTVELSKILFPMSISYTLGDLAYELNIPLENAHRADDDALATAALLKRCWEELLLLPESTLTQLHKRSFRLKADVSQLFFDALQYKRKHIPQSEGYFYVRHFALKSGQAGEARCEQPLPYPFATEEKMNLMKRAFVHFEERPQQFAMMDDVWQALEKRQELAIEASTGIGKTLAYMLPAIIYAQQTKKKVAVSTYTSHLLDQLLMEEVPKLEQIIGSRVRVALLKGMHHYIDLARFEQLMLNEDASYDETVVILQVLIWLTKTSTGDLNELNVSGGGQLFLDKIRKSHVSSLASNKTFDFYNKALKQSMKADVIITNHAMLVADLERKEPLFDAIGGWIIDEAHQFIQAAASREEKLLSFTRWKYIFGKIGSLEAGHLLAQFYTASLQKQKVPIYYLQQLEKNYIKMSEHFDFVMNMLAKQLQMATNNGSKTEVKITIPLEDLPIKQLNLQSFTPIIWQWIDDAEQAAQLFSQHIDELTAEETFLLSEWHYWIREMKVKAMEWDAIFYHTEDDLTTWVEMDRRNVPGSIQIIQKPVHIKATMHQLFDEIRKQAAIIWTSGTLTVPNNTRFITEQLAIPEQVPIRQWHADPSYYQGATAYIVTDMPDIQQVSQSNYIEAIAHAITSTVRTTEGRCFVLFTSQDMLRKTVSLIQDSELLDDYMLFAQGVTSGSRMKLLKSFQKFTRSILFGTNSFWEGVDVPGDALSAVIVVRLPFSAPDEPIFKARAKQLTAQGVNSFNELSLPEAILRFKQGFGRLIRSSQDKGAFIILDRRIESKSYGKEFLKALPPISVQKLSLSHMVLALENCYNSKERN